MIIDLEDVQQVLFKGFNFSTYEIFNIEKISDLNNTFRIETNKYVQDFFKKNIEIIYKATTSE